MIELTFLGTASAIPTRDRNHTCLVVKVSDRMILFDCGEGTQRQFMEAGISPMKIDDIYITHLHGDHILGLPGIIQSLAFRGRSRDLNIYGPEGITALIESCKRMGYCAIGYDIIVHEINCEVCEIYRQSDFKVCASLMKHTVPDYAYKIEEIRQPKFLRQKAIDLGIKPGPLFGKLQAGEEVEVNGKIIKPSQVTGPPREGVKVVFSGDTIPLKKMEEFAENANVLIHEATFTEDMVDKALENGHSTPCDVAKIANNSNVELLILTHLSNRYTDSKPLVDEAREFFDNTIYAYDFMQVVINNNNPVEVKNLK